MRIPSFAFVHNPVHGGYKVKNNKTKQPMIENNPAFCLKN